VEEPAQTGRTATPARLTPARPINITDQESAPVDQGSDIAVQRDRGNGTFTRVR
jgi:hypothetical protein